MTTLREELSKVLACGPGEILYIGIEQDADPMEVRVVFDHGMGKLSATNIFIDEEGEVHHIQEINPACLESVYSNPQPKPTDIPY